MSEGKLPKWECPYCGIKALQGHKKGCPRYKKWVN